MSDAVTREETLLNAIATGETVDIVPVTRKEKYLRYLAGIGEKPSKPITREEMFLDKIQAGGGTGGGAEEASVLDSLIDGSITGDIIIAATIIKPYALRSCNNLASVKVTNATDLQEGGFWYCENLKKADFDCLTSIGTSVFYYCQKLTQLILRGEILCSLAAENSFMGTPIRKGTGYIYVPSSLIEEYKAATNWSAYAARFRALEDYTVDGTITGKLDESKI